MVLVRLRQVSIVRCLVTAAANQRIQVWREEWPAMQIFTSYAKAFVRVI